MKVLGLIPARGGSKGVPEKNRRPLAGRSLVERAYACGAESGVLDRIVLSTDDQVIAELASGTDLEVPFLRPVALARDDTPMVSVVRHSLDTLAKESYEPDAVLLLQPTSPLRRPEHLRRAVELLGDGFDSVCSVVPLPREMCPHYVMKIDDEGLLRHFLPEGAEITRRQDVLPAYRRDGTVYLTRSRVVLEEGSLYGERCVPMLLDPEESLSVDRPTDWQEATRRLGEG